MLASTLIGQRSQVERGSRTQMKDETHAQTIYCMSLTSSKFRFAEFEANYGLLCHNSKLERVAETAQPRTLSLQNLLCP